MGGRTEDREAMGAKKDHPKNGNDRDEANQYGVHTGIQFFVAGPQYCGRHTTLSHLSFTMGSLWHHFQLTLQYSSPSQIRLAHGFDVNVQHHHPAVRS
jgi:hypothetical protein